MLLADVHEPRPRRQGRAREGPGRPAGRPALRHAGRRGRRDPLLLRQGRVRRVRPGHEDDRGRPVHRATRILSKFEMAELADGPGRAGRVADVRGDRRRSDRRRAGRADRRARAHRAAARLPLDQHPRCADRPARGCAVGAAALRQEAAGLHPPRAGEDGSGDPPQLPRRSRMDHESITFKGPDGVADDPRPAPGSGRPASRRPRWRSSSPSKAGAETDRAGRIPVNPDCTAAGAPGGVRDRRHGVAEQAPRGGAAGAAGGPLRRQGDQEAAGGAEDIARRSSTSTRARWRPSATGRRWPTRSGSRSPACSPTSCGRSSTSGT